MAPIKALLFDVFGTVVDWRRCVSAEIDALAKKYGIEVDAAEMADAWRAEYQPAMEEIRAERRPFDILDILHGENLDRVLAKFHLEQIVQKTEMSLILPGIACRTGRIAQKG